MYNSADHVSREAKSNMVHQRQRNEAILKH